VTPDDKKIEEHIRQTFRANYERLRSESGHALSPDVVESAFQHVLLYWRRLRELANSVTDTEVRLNLPGRESPAGRKFSIEGVVDIVRAEGKTGMYDVKTQDSRAVQKDIDFYREQLNVYAYIWKHLHQQPLDHAAIIATQFPEEVKKAMEGGDAAAMEKAIAGWDPLVPIPFDDKQVEDTVTKFGKAVDAIEAGKFDPAPVAKLRKPEYKNRPFAVNVCRNCDARYSCASYREYANAPGHNEARRFREYFGDLGTPEERADRVDVTLQATDVANPADEV
jgi:hypothetical protein